MGFLERALGWWKGAPSPTPAPSTPAEAPPALPERVDRARARDDKRAARSLRAAEERASKAEERAMRAEERARAAEKEQASMEAARESAATRIALAGDRARLAELALKKEVEAHEKTRAKKSGAAALGGDSARDARGARQADDRLRAARGRADQAERERDDAAERARGLEKRCLELTASLEEQRERARALEARSPHDSASAAPETAALESTQRTTAEAHFSPGEACLEVIRDQLARARQSADVCVFTITDDRIATSLLRAHDRGIRVRVITDDDKSLDEGSDVDRLARSGIPVRRDRSEYHMHHKFAVFDGRRLITGSYNWTRGAARNNEENLVLVSDPRLVVAFEREFEQLWAKFSE